MKFIRMWYQPLPKRQKLEDWGWKGFVTNVVNAVRIRTGEDGDDALVILIQNFKRGYSMTIKKVLNEIKGDYEYVDMRFTDPRGKLQHVCYGV